MTNSNSQISEVIGLNPRFSMFSSKISVRVLILKEFSLVYIYGVSMAGKHVKLFRIQNFFLDRPEITKTLMVDLS